MDGAIEPYKDVFTGVSLTAELRTPDRHTKHNQLIQNQFNGINASALF